MLARQEILPTMHDRSYDLLEQNQKALLARLCVFREGWSLEAAQTICSGGVVEAGEVPDLLTALGNRTLVIDEQGRYRMPETVREEACERLGKSGEAEAVAERHRDYFLALAEEADSHLTGAEQGEWLARLETEHSNLRAALSWSIGKQEDRGAAALRLCGALPQFWWTRGHIEEGRRWCASALELAGAAERSAERARVLNGAGVLARMQGDYAAARAYHEQSLEIRSEIEDKKGIAASFNGLGNVANSQGDYTAARLSYEQSLAIKQEIGDQKAVAGSLNNLGFVAYLQGDYAAARLSYEQSLAIRREGGNGNVQAIATTLKGLAEVAAAEGDGERGAILWGAGEALREQSGAPLPSSDREVRDRDVATARQAMGEEAFSLAWAKGRAMTLEQCLAFVLEMPV